MTAVTRNTAEIRNGVQFLESVNVSAVAASTPVKRSLSVPPWATKLTITIFVDAMSGTSETLDFTMGVPDWGSLTLLASPTDATDQAIAIGNAAWNGITQVTAAGPSQIVIEVGPDVTDDDTGSATASCYYGVKTELPPIINYTYTYNGTGDEAYTFRIAAVWR